MMTISLKSILLLSFLLQVDCWSTSSRAKFLQSSVVATTGAFFIPSEAHADITNKLASTAALRKVRQGQSKLAEMEFYITNNEYESLQQALRKEPFFDIRKNSFILVRGGEDGPLAGELEESYKNFMASMEKMDTTATLGKRGRRPLAEGEFYGTYRSTVDSLEKFLAVAKEAADVPVQYKD